MNWQQFTDHVVGHKPTFTNKEVRDIVQQTLCYASDNWTNHRR